jgi:4-hydroxysphinganine ceramide fatty acyl 2-hydroxylase
MTLSVAGLALLGAFTWTFLEYCIHRWLGHDRRFRSNVFAREHIRHHIEGNYFAPTWKKTLFTLGLSAVLIPLFVLLLGPSHGIAYVGGLIGFYTIYELLHRLEHVHQGFGPYGRWARRHHFYHHFENGKMNHGVTSPLWDLVFGTYRKPELIHVPKRLCMEWLRDPETGGARREFQGSFEIAA